MEWTRRIDIHLQAISVINATERSEGEIAPLINDGWQASRLAQAAGEPLKAGVKAVYRHRHRQWSTLGLTLTLICRPLT